MIDLICVGSRFSRTSSTNRTYIIRIKGLSANTHSIKNFDDRVKLKKKLILLHLIESIKVKSKNESVNEFIVLKGAKSGENSQQIKNDKINNISKWILKIVYLASGKYNIQMDHPKCFLFFYCWLLLMLSIHFVFNGRCAKCFFFHRYLSSYDQNASAYKYPWCKLVESNFGRAKWWIVVGFCDYTLWSMGQSGV